MGARLRRVAFEARAKLNLGLAIGPKRADGFHDLATIFQSISLADRLIATRARRGFRLRVRHETVALAGTVALSRVPSGAKNLVLRAARRVAARTGFRGGARFELIKRVPAAAGLGGGSADAAAAITALDVLYRLGLGPRGRAVIAAEIGSDVPFAIRGGTALGLGRGDRLTPVRLASPFRALIAVPRWGIPTARAYRQIDRKKFGLTWWKAKLISAQNQAAKPVKPENALGLGNTFEGVLGARRQDFLSLRGRLHAAGLSSIAMTGSGSAVFGLLDPGETFARVARRFRGTESLYAVRSMRAGLRRVAVE